MVTVPYDLRIWDQYLSESRPLVGLKSVEITQTDGWGIDTATLTAPADHPLGPWFRYAETAPVIVTFSYNGEFWSGQITKPSRTRDEWVLRCESDHKHGHRMLALSPSAGVPSQLMEGDLGSATFNLVGSAAARTGLPVYLLMETTGPGFEAEVRVEDTVAAVLDSFHAGADAYLDVRLLLPGQDIPGSGPVARVMGPAEWAWTQGMLEAGRWPEAALNDRLVGVGSVGDHTAPPRAFVGEAGLDLWGGELPEPVEGACWTPFSVRGQSGEGYSAPVVRANTRVAEAADLTVHSGNRVLEGKELTFGEFGAFVTAWPASRWDLQKEGAALGEAIAAGLLVEPSGEPLGSLDEVSAYLGSTPQMFAWLRGSSWVLATESDMEAEVDVRISMGVPTQPQTPGLLVRLHEGRDRREIVFTTARGGGLEEFETTINAPDGAALIAGVQSDQWAIDLGGATPKVNRLPAGAVPTDSPLSEGMSERVQDVTVDVAPTDVLPGSSVSFGSVVGGVDISVAGPFFFRERYASLSGESVVGAVRQLEQAWADSQGGSSMTFTPSPDMRQVLGNDLIDEDGAVIPGWRIGDRISFADGDTQVSEVVSGWTFKHEGGKAPQVEPILGKRIHAYDPLGELVDTATRGVTAGVKSQLAPPVQLPTWRIEEIADGRIVNGTADIRAALRGELSGQFELLDDMREVTGNMDGLLEEAIWRSERISGLADDLAGKVDSQSDLIRALEPLPDDWEVLNAALWGTQGLINTDNAQAWQEQGLANALNSEMWGEQGKVNAIQDGMWEIQGDVNEAVAGQLTLHENQLRWINQSQRSLYHFNASRPYLYKTTELEIFADEIESDYFYFANWAQPEQDRFGGWDYSWQPMWAYIKPQWVGEIIIRTFDSSGAETGKFIHEADGSLQEINLPFHSRYRIEVFPSWGPGSREFVFQAQERLGRGFTGTLTYRVNGEDLVQWGEDGVASFAFPVVASHTVRRKSGSSWLTVAQGAVINANTWINNHADSLGGLVVFTEVLPVAPELPVRPDLRGTIFSRQYHGSFYPVRAKSGGTTYELVTVSGLSSGGPTEVVSLRLNLSINITNPPAWVEWEVLVNGVVKRSKRHEDYPTRIGSTIITIADIPDPAKVSVRVKYSSYPNAASSMGGWYLTATVTP